MHRTSRRTATCWSTPSRRSIAASPALRRVVLVTGTKYYGSHLGPFKTPARESDPRHCRPELLFRPDRLARRLPARQALGLGGAAAADLVRLCAGHADESGAGDRGLRRDQQGARAAAAFPGKARRLHVDLSGHRIRALRQRGAVGGGRAALRARSVQHHQRRLFPLAEPVAEARRRLRHAGRRRRRPSASPPTWRTRRRSGAP